MDRQVKLFALALIVVLFGLFVTLQPPSDAAATPLTGIRSVAAAQSHTCALMVSGQVKCWGSNAQGRLGDGNFANQVRPAMVEGLTDIVAIATGSAFTCALTGEGGVKCWGVGGQGELGDGEALRSSTPVNVVGLEDIVAIGAGSQHACAINRDGALFCWGRGPDGAIGVPVAPGARTEPVLTPVHVAALDVPVTAVVGGGGYTCALTDQGTVKCWGGNWAGVLGNGSDGRGGPNPVDVVGLTGVTQIEAGSATTCALIADGRVYCWGRRTGTGEEEPVLTPVELETLSGPAVSVSVAAQHSCALLESGRVECWGGNFNGQLGDGTTEDSAFPVQVELGSLAAIAVSAGFGFTCAVVEGGGLWCWGDNTLGRLGAVTTEYCTRSHFGACALTPLEALSTIPGDTDCDGWISGTDPHRILLAEARLFTLSECGKDSDVNRDGLINSIDAFILRQFIAALFPNARPQLSSSVPATA